MGMTWIKDQIEESKGYAAWQQGSDEVSVGDVQEADRLLHGDRALSADDFQAGLIALYGPDGSAK